MSAVEFHAEVDSTQDAAARAVARGVEEIHLVLADTQTAGRGRQERPWLAPAGTSLLASLVLRPGVAPAHQSLLPLLAGLTVAEVVDRYCADVALKWPNDLLLGGRKAGGLLTEVHGDAVLLGLGVNVDWRGVPRPEEVGDATSLAEQVEQDVDRWRLLAALLGIFGHRYADWRQRPTAFLDDYRRRCATLGRRVRVDRSGAEPLAGTATHVADDGTLVLRLDGGAVAHVSAGDVTHVRAV